MANDSDAGVAASCPVETTGVPTVEIDGNGVITQWLGSGVALLGWNATEVENRTLASAIVAPRDHERFDAWLSEQSTSASSCRLAEFCVVARDGSAHDALFKLGDPKDDGYCISIRVLVDERAVLPNEAEDEASQQAHFIREILNALPHAIFWKDRSGRFLGGNAAFVSYSRALSIEEMVGKTDHDFFPADQAQFYRECDMAVIQTGRPLLDVEEPICRRDEVRTLLTSKVPLRDVAGTTVGVAGIFMDITERKRIEKALAEARALAESAVKAKSEFLTVASHELRTPLTLILGPLERLLERDDLETPVRTELERIRRNAARLHVLVNDILDVAKAEAGRTEIEWDAIDVASIVGGIVADATGAAEARGLTLTFVERDPVGLVPLDRGKFEKIILNLVANALKFTPRGGRVEVALRRLPEGPMELAVSDTGIGIAPEQRDRVFDRFHQVDSSSRRGYEGTGLGLSLVKSFAELMGGTVSVESEPGCGSRFVVRLVPPARSGEARRGDALAPAPTRRSVEEILPMPRVPTSPQVLEVEPASVERARRPRVLVVEDNADMRAFLEDILQEDYSIETAEDGCSGLARAREGPFDVVVTDVMMPCLDGLELVRQLKEDTRLRNVPVILLTAKASPEDLALGLRGGADDYLKKPFSPSELKARVFAALRLRRAIIELETTLEALKRAQADLVQSEKLAAVGTLVAGLSHELNNPLAVISMNTELLMSQPGCESVARRALPTIRLQVDRCTQLVRTLLDFSRKRQLVREPVSLEELLRPLHQLALPIAERRGVRLELDGSPLGDADAKVNVCRQEIETAILNLVTNAIAATPKGGAVAIRVRRAARGATDGVVVSVVDTGEGISPAVAARIFDPFFTTKPPGEGTGIGLPLARKIVESHGGGIRIESAVGRGTEATAWLPLCASVPA